MRIVAIIPARFASTRFPGKPLVDIGGKTMIQRVVERVQSCKSISEVIVATDDERILHHVETLGAKCLMTSASHASGTDRCMEAVRLCGTRPDAIINVQGDEPFVDPSQIDSLAQHIASPSVSIATLVKKITDSKTLLDPSKVKVVMSTDGRAIYFSRHAIPYYRGSMDPQEWLEHHTYYKHIGLYAYKAETLEAICRLKPSSLELAESLEQLRWIENGFVINAIPTEIETPSIDTPEDLVAVLKHYFS